MSLSESERDAICDVFNGRADLTGVPLEALYAVVERIAARRHTPNETSMTSNSTVITWHPSNNNRCAR